MKLIDFKEELAKKNGKVTPRSLAKNLLQGVDEYNIKSIIYIAVDETGEYFFGYTSSRTESIIGDLEIGKHLILRDMEE